MGQHGSNAGFGPTLLGSVLFLFCSVLVFLFSCFRSCCRALDGGHPTSRHHSRPTRGANGDLGHHLNAGHTTPNEGRKFPLRSLARVLSVRLTSNPANNDERWPVRRFKNLNYTPIYLRSFLSSRVQFSVKRVPFRGAYHKRALPPGRR